MEEYNIYPVMPGFLFSSHAFKFIHVAAHHHSLYWLNIIPSCGDRVSYLSSCQLRRMLPRARLWKFWCAHMFLCFLDTF